MVNGGRVLLQYLRQGTESSTLIKSPKMMGLVTKELGSRFKLKYVPAGEGEGGNEKETFCRRNSCCCCKCIVITVSRGRLMHRFKIQDSRFMIQL